MNRLSGARNLDGLTAYRRPRAPQLLLATIGLLTLIPAGIGAGSLSVTNDAASEGDFGLEVTVGETCAQEDVLISGGTFSGDSEIACNQLTAENVEVVAPGAFLLAGVRIVLGNGFSVPPGVALEAAVDPLVATPLAALQDDSPDAEPIYSASFDLRLDSLSLADGDVVDHLNGYSQNGDLQFRAVLRWNTVLFENRLALFARQDDGSYLTHPTDFLLPDGFNRIQIYWRAGAGSGQFLASINGAPLFGITGLENATAQVAYVRWGAVGGTISTTTGSLDQDSFLSTRN